MVEKAFRTRNFTVGNKQKGGGGGLRGGNPRARTHSVRNVPKRWGGNQGGVRCLKEQASGEGWRSRRTRHGGVNEITGDRHARKV